MKPAPFEYLRPKCLDEAIQYLSEYGEVAKILSGGQSLIPLFNMRLATPEYVIDLNFVEELNYIHVDEDKTKLHIGALTRHFEVEGSLLVQEKCSLLAEAIRYVGHAQIRHRGTIGGSIAHADPSAELPCVLSALRGDIVITGTEGERVVKPEDFFLTHMITVLEPTEMVKEVRFPVLSANSGSAFLEFARRHGDFALVEVAAVIEMGSNDQITAARLAIGGTDPVPVVLEEVESFILGEQPTEELFTEASQKVGECIEPEDDAIHGSAAYKSRLAASLTERALTIAAQKAKGGQRSEES